VGYTDSWETLNKQHILKPYYFLSKSFLFLYVFVISYTNLAVHLYWHHTLYEETIIYVKPRYHQHVVIIKKKLVVIM